MLQQSKRCRGAEVSSLSLSLPLPLSLLPSFSDSITSTSPLIHPEAQRTTTSLPLKAYYSRPSSFLKIMTRSHKHNDRDHAGLADGTAEPEQHLPRYFAKTGHIDADPKKTKKDGGGKGNWGRSGDEIEDGSFNLAKPRRRSNSSMENTRDFKTKFETIEQDPVFEEEIHGDGGEDHYQVEHDQQDLDKQSTSESSVESSVEGDGPGKL